MRSKRPRCHHENSKEEIDEDVKRVNTVIANRRVGRSRACHVEEDAGIRSFFERRKTRYE